MRQQNTDRKRAVINSLVTAGVIAVVAVVFFFTRTPPEGEAPKVTSQQEIIETVQRDLEMAKLTEEQQKEIDSWKEEGFIRSVMESSHEVWLDTERWSALTKEGKEETVRKLSRYLKQFDGTNQVMVRADGSNEWLADYFADTIRVK
jgi:hypothetical protein